RGIRVALQIIRVGDRGPTDLGGTIEVVERGPELLESLFHDLRRDRLTGSRNDLRAWIHALRYGLQQSAQHRWHDGDRIRAVGLDELHRSSGRNLRCITIVERSASASWILAKPQVWNIGAAR